MTNLLEKVPNFPKWRKFITDDLGWYELFYISRLLPYAEPSPINIRTWVSAHDDLRIAKLGEILIMKFSNILDDNNPTFFMLGKSIDEISLRELFKYQLENGLPAEVGYIPIELIGVMPCSDFAITVQRDDAEYLFSCEEHFELEGPAFYKLRQQVSYFKRLNNDRCLTIAHVKSSDEYRQNINFVLENWKLTANNSAPNIEGDILKKIASIGDWSKIKMLTLSIDNRLASVVIYSVYNKTAIIQHIKVDYGYNRIFGYTTHILAQELYKQGVEYMNLEQDLGIEGLRQYKKRLRPVKLLQKARVTPNYSLD